MRHFVKSTLVKQLEWNEDYFVAAINLLTYAARFQVCCLMQESTSLAMVGLFPIPYHLNWTSFTELCNPCVMYFFHATNGGARITTYASQNQVCHLLKSNSFTIVSIVTPSWKIFG